MAVAKSKISIQMRWVLILTSSPFLRDCRWMRRGAQELLQGQVQLECQASGRKFLLSKLVTGRTQSSNGLMRAQTGGERINFSRVQIAKYQSGGYPAFGDEIYAAAACTALAIPRLAASLAPARRSNSIAQSALVLSLHDTYTNAPTSHS